MPTRERVQAFVAMVEAGDYVEAIRQFYTDDATMQENLGTTRAGSRCARGAEEATLKKAVDHHASGLDLRDRRRPRDRALGVRYRAGGRQEATLDELAYQLWRGDCIAQERFYYDPAQRKPE